MTYELKSADTHAPSGTPCSEHSDRIDAVKEWDHQMPDSLEARLQPLVSRIGSEHCLLPETSLMMQVLPALSERYTNVSNRQEPGNTGPVFVTGKTVRTLQNCRVTDTKERASRARGVCI